MLASLISGTVPTTEQQIYVVVIMCFSVAGMGMSQTDAIAGGRRPVVKGSMGVDDMDIDDDDVCSFHSPFVLIVGIVCNLS